MLKLLSLLAFSLVVTTAWSATKPAPQYQDGVLISFTTVSNGSTCSSNGQTTGTVDSTGTISGKTNTSTSCSDNLKRHYTVKVGDSMFVLSPAMSKKAKGAALASLGWSAVFSKNSVLANQLPGTHFQIWSDEDGMHVRIGKRESLYSVVAAN
jgi:hypothetical protein